MAPLPIQPHTDTLSNVAYVSSQRKCLLPISIGFTSHKEKYKKLSSRFVISIKSSNENNLIKMNNHEQIKAKILTLHNYNNNFAKF